MVTNIQKDASRRLFLKEHRKAKGVSAEDMAEKLGIERESVYRLEREAYTRLNPAKQVAYAKALGIKPGALWRPPEVHSLDEMVADVDKDLRDTAVDIVRRLISRKG